MPLPEGLARFNRVATNKVMRPLARRMSGFCVLRHTGRKTGNVYETPLNAFPDEDRIVVALTYGSDVDWLKNARASGQSVTIIGGEELTVGRPDPVTEPEGLGAVPPWVRLSLAVLNVDEFVSFPVVSG